MKKILVSIVVIMMLLSVVGLAGCSKQGDDVTTTTTSTTNKGTDTTDNNSTTTTTNKVVIEETQVAPEDAAMFEYSAYGYHIYYPKGFEVLNNEGNMVEFMNDAGVDFTVLVLDNKYDSLSKMMDSQMDDEEYVVKQGSNYFLTCSQGNGRTNYIYYYYGEDMVRCELSYEDSQKDAMKGLENKIMVEAHGHSH